MAGDAKLQVEGKADQAEGKRQNAVGGIRTHALQGLRRLKRTWRAASRTATDADAPLRRFASCGDAVE